MKNLLKGLGVFSLAVGLSIGSIEAKTETRKINTQACDTVYTNYYLFLDGNVFSYFNNGPLSTLKHSTVAEYWNNSYQISNFDANNIGYGQVAVSPTTTTSSDGLTSMSLDDYYRIFKTSAWTNGAYSSGKNNYIVSHNWYKVNPDGSQTLQDSNGPTTINQVSINQLKRATISAVSDFTLQSRVTPVASNPFQIRVDRSYFGYLTGEPVSINGLSWYLHPAVYYVQYCSPKAVENFYTVRYVSRTTDLVENMPNDATYNTRDGMTISTKIPRRTGYTFKGWTTDSSSPVADQYFAPGKQYTDRKDLTLYAVWQLNTQEPIPSESYYNIHYVSRTTDYVENMPSDSRQNTKYDIAIASNIPRRAGYTFKGWTTESNSSVANSNYAPGKQYTLRRDVTLYAVWQLDVQNPTPNETYYNIHYVSRTTDYVENMPSDSRQNTKYDIAIASNIPRRAGYTFKGWTTDSASPVADAHFAPGTQYTDRKDLTLYAVWQINTQEPTNPDKPNLDNPQTGITNCLLPFGGVAGISGLGISILKKKKGFKQF